MKEMRNFGEDYFAELLERIRDISASEKRFYQKITEFYASSVDYSPDAEITKRFFATVQNKLHFATHGQATAELISDRADLKKENMGLTSWQGDKVRQRDVTVARNYLNKKEIRALNRIVTRFLDYAEDQAERKRPVYMKEWKKRLDTFLEFDEREILQDVVKIEKAVADKIAIEAYEEYNQHRIVQNTPDDFDEFLGNNNLKK